MNRHDYTHSEAARFARYAARARAAGDIQSAVRFEAKALSLVEAAPLPPRAGVLGRRLFVAAGFALAVLLGAPGAAQAAGPKKPTVCAAFKIIEVESDSKVYAVCNDGKRPKLFVSWKTVDVVDPETGAAVRYMVGF